MGIAPELVNIQSSVLDRPQYRGLRPWKPGQSGNPGGRKKKITRALDRVLNKAETMAMAKAVVREAQKGNVKAFEAVRDTIEGRPSTTAELDGTAGNSMQVVIVRLGSGE